MAFLIKITCLILALLQFGAGLIFNNGSAVMTIDKSSTYQQFGGWGTSAAWWAQMISDEVNAQALARALFNKNEGLGINIYRYNIGAGEADNPATRIGDVSRRAESFYVFNEESGEYEYDFTRDANARRMLDLAVKNGVSEVILFCNSPHYSMTVSGHASGGLTPAFSNLPRENYEKFVDYVLTIADYFVEQGYPVTYISPINEPQWDWGGDWVGQEGCHYTVDEAVELLEMFATKMQQQNKPYKLSGIESGCMAMDSLEWLDRFFESDILNSYCDAYSGHSYWRDFWYYDKDLFGKYFAEHYPDKKLEMSEWCELPCKTDSRAIESGLHTANVIMQDLTLLNVTSWQSWVAVNGTGYDENGAPISDGFFRANGDYSAIEVNNRYYAFKQFSAFIKPGMVRKGVNIIKSKTQGLEYAAFTDGETDVFVIINNSDGEQCVRIASERLSKAVYLTDAEHNCEKVFSGVNTVSTALPAKSITTVVFS